jgi:hypothetical protein
MKTPVQLWWSVPALEQRGAITVWDPGFPEGRRRVIFQRTGRRFGNIPHGPSGRLQVRSYFVPSDPKAPSCVPRRARFAEGVARWRAMDAEERAEWKAYGAPRQLPAYQAFLSWWMRHGDASPFQLQRNGSILRNGLWTRGG